VASKVPQAVVVDPVRRGHYADYPACLPNYKWLIEEALKVPERMFNSPTIPDVNAHYCKACGAAYRKADFAAHVNEHAEQLKMLGRVVMTKKGEIVRTEIEAPKVSEELKLTIIDSLSERLPDLELAFTINYGLLGDKLARLIDDVSKDGGASVPPLCEDCHGA
jgi:hypothetical protein